MKKAQNIELTKPLRNVRLYVAYDGSAFFGFQYQPGVPTVQGELERAFKLITKETSRAIGAGRTDAGVHAIEQVVLFKTRCPIPVEKLIIGMNSALGGALRICRAEEANDLFHPCFSARCKHYRYLYHFVEKRSPFLERFYWQIETGLDLQLMQQAAKTFTGTNDFAAFTKSPNRYESTFRTVLQTQVSSQGEMIVFDVTGEGFMHNMVRNMAKALYLVGLNELKTEELRELYRNRNRKRLGAPAPPGGLYLMKVMY